MFLVPDIFLWIIFAYLNNDCSAKGKSREPKSVWLEPYGHEDSEYVK
jgi:hypothetical protein